jgi:hypothetical protein
LEHYLDGLSKRSAYDIVFTRWPDLLEIRLDEPNRKTLEELRTETKLAGADVRASEADKRWMGELNLVEMMPFAVIYLLCRRPEGGDWVGITGALGGPIGSR